MMNNLFLLVITLLLLFCFVCLFWIDLVFENMRVIIKQLVIVIILHL